MLKIFLATALLPYVYGFVKSFGSLLMSLYPPNSAEMWFLSGFVFFIALLFLKIPLSTVYVFGHELTHAIWAFIFRGRVKEFNVSADKGSVVTTKTNFLIQLAPYFFPVYSFLLIVLFYFLAFFFEVSKYVSWLFFLVGFSFSFHVFLTFDAVSMEQSDIKKTGKMFSYVVIVILNVIMLSVLLKFVSPGKVKIGAFIVGSHVEALKGYKFSWRVLTELYYLIK